MNQISTHVLDTSQGKPAKGVPVRLEKRDPAGAWVRLGSSVTDGDGRCSSLLGENETLSKGLYRLSFDTATYYLAERVEGLYPVVEITFEAREGESRFHIPLLLSPHGYTTYRGS
jgi:5-hydroxyisourate hydrolase